jgi:hypothetical protein
MNGLTRTPGYTGGGIRCLGRVSIPCWPVAPAVFPISNVEISSQNRCVQIRETEQSVAKISTSRQINQCPVQANGKSSVKIKLTQTPGNTRGRIKCLGGASIPCRSVRPAARPVPWSWMRSRSQCAKYGLTIGMKNVRQHMARYHITDLHRHFSALSYNNDISIRRRVFCR